MSEEKARPLVAYALVALLCALLLAIGMHTPQPQLLHQVQRPAAGQPHLQVQTGALLEPRSETGDRPAEPTTLSDAVNGQIDLAVPAPATPTAVRTVSGPSHHRAGHRTAAPAQHPRHHVRSHQRGHQPGHQRGHQRAQHGHGPPRAHGSGHGHAHPGGHGKLRQLQRWLQKPGSAPASPNPWKKLHHGAEHHRVRHHGLEHHRVRHHGAEHHEKAHGKAHHGGRWVRAWHWRV